MGRLPWCVGAFAVCLLAGFAAGGVDAEGPAALKVRGSLLPEGDADVFRFTAAEGTLLSFKLASVKKAPLAFAPVLTGPGDAVVPLTGAASGPGAWSISGLALPSSGAYALRVAASGTGDYTLALKAKVKGLRTLKLDVRAASLGRPAGGETFLRRVVGAAGGALAVEDPACDLDGAALAVPPGAVADGTGVFLRSTEALPSAHLDRIAAGPAAEVGPADLLLQGGATLSLPYDPGRMPLDASPADLEVLMREGREPPALTAPAAPPGEGFVLAAIPGPCAAGAAVRFGRPRLESTSWWIVNIRADFQPGADSRYRRFAVDHGSVVLHAGSADLFLEDRWVEWQDRDVPDTGSPPLVDAAVVAGSEPVVGTLGWSWDGGGLLRFDDPDAPAFLPGRTGQVMVSSSGGADGNAASLGLALRRGAGPFTLGDFAGTWQWGGLQAGASGDTGPGSPARLAAWRGYGTLTINASGTTVLAGKQIEQEFDPQWNALRETVQSFSFKGTASLLPGGRVRLDFGPGDRGPPPLLCMPGAGGTAMIVVPEAPDEGGLLAIVAVRRAVKFQAAAVNGPVAGASFGMDLMGYPLPGSRTAPDIEAGWERIEGTVAGADREFSLSLQGAWVRRSGETGALAVEDTDDSITLPFSASGKGVVKATDPEGGSMTGAVTGDGEFWFLMPDPGRRGSDDFLVVFVRVP